MTTTKMTMDDLEILHEEMDAHGAFHIEGTEGRLAELVYRRLDERHVVIVHTEVSAQLQGRGVARRLLDAAVAWARTSGTRVGATCPYALAQFKKDASLSDVFEP